MRMLKVLCVTLLLWLAFPAHANAVNERAAILTTQGSVEDEEDS
jgi:hypothetical protein